MKCSIKECTKERYAKTYCVNHYAVYRRNGSPIPTINRHGLTETPEWKSWASMRKRCKTISSSYFQRGITICERWDNRQDGFMNFLNDMGKKPTLRHSIDRIDNNGNYEPSNCRWATPEEQSKEKKTLEHRRKMSQIMENYYAQKI